MSKSENELAPKPPISRRKPVAAKEKQKPVAFVNWRIPHPDFPEDSTKNLLKSTRGFSVFENEHLTRQERALVKLAQDNDGVAIIDVELRIVVAQDTSGELDTSKIPLKK